MPRAAKPPAVARIPLPEALARLGVSRVTFWRHWQRFFTDCRASGRPGRGKCFVLDDELGVAVADGPAAVLAFRRLMGRV